MSKLLNLDELVSEERTLIYKGIEYTIGAIPLRSYLSFQRENQEFRKAEDDMSRMQFGLRGVKLAIPTFPDDELEDMNMKQVVALMEFVGEILSENSSPNLKVPAQESEPPAAEDLTEEEVREAALQVIQGIQAKHGDEVIREAEKATGVTTGLLTTT